MVILELALLALLVVFLVFTVLFLIGIVISQHLDSPFVPTPKEAARTMLSLAGVKPGETVLDLGSGDGQILFTAAEDFGARAAGVELNPLLYAWTKWVIARKRLGRALSVAREHVLAANLREADVITLYLYPALIKSLEPKLLREAKPNVRIVSRAFPLQSFTLLETRATKPKIYLYRKPQPAASSSEPSRENESQGAR